MIREIKRIKLFANDNEKSKEILNKVKDEFINNDFYIVDKDFDLGIAIGGDGSFLRMLKNSNFNSDSYYVGINTGTLGFLQEIKPDEISEFIQKIKKKEFKIEEIGIQETTVVTAQSNSKFYSLNEILVREKELNTSVLDIYIDDILLERYVGDGIMVATSVGSTAYNLSFGGSIVYNTLHTLQITPVAPLNTKAYRDLLNSVVLPEDKVIKIVPAKNINDLLISVDGDNNCYKDIKEIITGVYCKKVKFLRLNDYSFTKIVNEKFLK